jgi:hypothetical protein
VFRSLERLEQSDTSPEKLIGFRNKRFNSHVFPQTVRWRDTHPSGAASIEWFDRWCNPEIRQRILDYNEDDCRATRVLLDGIRSLAA